MKEDKTVVKNIKILPVWIYSCVAAI